MLSFSQLVGHFLQLKARRNFLSSAQTGKKTRPFLFKINSPWKARTDSVSLGPSRALCCLFLVVLWPLASRSMNQHIGELQGQKLSHFASESPAGPTLDTCASIDFFMCLRWLAVYSDDRPSDQSCGWKFKLIFKLTPLFHTKKSVFQPCVKLVLTYPKFQCQNMHVNTCTNFSAHLMPFFGVDKFTKVMISSPSFHYFLSQSNRW